jgi:hypothetical protein
MDIGDRTWRVVITAFSDDFDDLRVNHLIEKAESHTLPLSQVSLRLFLLPNQKESRKGTSLVNRIRLPGRLGHLSQQRLNLCLHLLAAGRPEVAHIGREVGPGPE